MTRLLFSYPDYKNDNEGYVLTLIELIASLADDEIAAVMDLQTGIRAKSKFLPSVAEIQELVSDYRKTVERRSYRRPIPVAAEDAYWRAIGTETRQQIKAIVQNLDPNMMSAANECFRDSSRQGVIRFLKLRDNEGRLRITGEQRQALNLAYMRLLATAD